MALKKIDAPRDFGAVKTTDLREILRQEIGLHGEAVAKIARVWRELVRRGEDMAEFKFALAEFMLPVAEERLLPDLVSTYAGQPRTLRRLAELPMSDQHRILADEPIALYSGSGVREVKPSEMTFGEAALAIRDGRIWSPDEQAMAHNRSAAKARKVGRPAAIRVTADGMVKIGGVEVAAERVIAALRAQGLIS